MFLIDNFDPHILSHNLDSCAIHSTVCKSKFDQNIILGLI